MRHGFTFSAIVAFVALAPLSAQTAPAHKQIEIRSMRAMPFDISTGGMDREIDLFVQSVHNLRRYNFQGIEHRTHFEMTMGSPVTYVEVEILIDPSLAKVEDSTIMELSAAHPRQAAQTQRVYLAEFNAISTPRIVRVPFFVYDEGCDKLVVTASVYSARVAYDHRTQTIPFYCGD